MEIKAKTRLIAAIVTIFILLGIGTVVYHHLEGWGYISSFYFSVVSVTTIGYGDLHPTSDVSRLFTAIYLLVGVATMLAALGIIGSAYIESREEQGCSLDEEDESCKRGKGKKQEAEPL